LNSTFIFLKDSEPGIKWYLKNQKFFSVEIPIAMLFFRMKIIEAFLADTPDWNGQMEIGDCMTIVQTEPL
jgi:hypothetical protein